MQGFENDVKAEDTKLYSNKKKSTWEFENDVKAEDTKLRRPF